MPTRSSLHRKEEGSLPKRSSLRQRAATGESCESLCSGTDRIQDHVDTRPPVNSRTAPAQSSFSMRQESPPSMASRPTALTTATEGGHRDSNRSRVESEPGQADRTRRSRRLRMLKECLREKEA